MYRIIRAERECFISNKEGNLTESLDGGMKIMLHLSGSWACSILSDSPHSYTLTMK